MPRIGLSLRIELPDGSRRYVKPNLKKQRTTLTGEVHPEGVYALRYQENGKRCWKAVGSDLGIAIAQRDILAAEMLLGRHNPEAKPKAPERLTFEEALASYLSNIQAAKSYRTAKVYRYALEQFRKVFVKKFLDEVRNKDLYNYAAALREAGLTARTIHNRIQEVTTFLRHFDIKDVGITVKYTEKKVKAYRADELQKFFAACTPDEWLVFQFFLGSGFREQEVAHMTWNDVDLERGIAMVKEKPGFTPKDHEERSVPLPSHLVAALREKQKAATSFLLFPGSHGKPEGHFLRLLKERAHKAGLNCGHCINKKGQSCAKHPVCDHWILHRFRKSFATMHHDSGVSARTIQVWLGHSDLETTLRYLADADIETREVREQVDKSFAAFV
jgi:integrase